MKISKLLIKSHFTGCVRYMGVALEFPLDINTCPILGLGFGPVVIGRQRCTSNKKPIDGVSSSSDSPRGRGEEIWSIESERDREGERKKKDELVEQRRVYRSSGGAEGAGSDPLPTSPQGRPRLGRPSPHLLSECNDLFFFFFPHMSLLIDSFLNP